MYLSDLKVLNNEHIWAHEFRKEVVDCIVNAIIFSCAAWYVEIAQPVFEPVPPSVKQLLDH